MRKILTFLLLLALAATAWAGEKTITISRNDVAWESANTVYNVTKGGVELVMSGGMNNPNFLLMKQHTTITVKSHNFNIKRIVFHCLDNFTNDNLDPFYWGPRTLHIQYSETHAEYAGKLTYDYLGNTYDACWNSTFSGTTSTNGTAHVNYPDGLPAGYELMFENEGKPVRFASIDIVVEQETGDMYEIVTEQSEVEASTSSKKVTYMLVGRADATTTQGYALSVNTTGSTANDDIKSTPVTLLENGLRVKANEETQFITFESTGNTSYPYYVKAGSNYIRTQSSLVETTGRRGYHLTKVANKPSEDYVRTKVTINSTAGTNNWGHFAAIKYQGSAFGDYAIRHIGQYTNENGTTNYYQFRNLYDQAYSDRRVYLYKPSQQYKVTTEVKPNAGDGSISLRDGILVDNGTNWSQKMETVQFLVTPINGKRIVDVTIAYDDDPTTTIDPLTVTPSINGTLYTFEMPGHNVHITATFEDVVYHNINIVVNPSGDYGNVFLTEGYVVQNDQVKSYNGENVVFNVTPNPIDIEHEENGYHELYSVTVTYTEGGQTISYTYTDGNYNFTMPDADVTITATFIYNNNNPLYLLGTANGGEFLPYGPRFNYDTTNEEYYIDVYFKGTEEFGGNTDNAYGYFCVSWGKWTTWDEVNQQTRRGMPYDNNYLISTDNPNYTLCYDDNKAKQGYSFKIPAGIYRIYVKSYGYHNDVLRIERTYPALTFDPAGGATAAEAVEVGQHQLVSLQGDLYNKIKAINPNEADANFMYKATVDGSTTTTESAGASTTTIATLDVVNEGETVTQLEGWNYLGWIVANNTGYYKVIDTPLHWIEENGDKGKTYTVSDRLQGVYAQGSSLWCKDLGDISIIKTTPNAGQVDYLAKTLTTADHLFPDAMRVGDWDQSNWVELDFSGFGANGNSMAADLKDHFIKAKTVTGVYSDDVNYTIKVSSTPEADGDASYVPNTYCTANFLESNLMSGTSAGPTINGTTYYFLNPKIQEYAIVTYAMWDKAQQIMVIPNNTPFDGAACIGRWDLNNVGNQLTALDAAFDAAFDAPETCNNVYEFHIIVQRTDKSYGTPAAATQQGAPALKDAPSLKPDQTASLVLRTQPLDLQAASPLPTAITRVGTEAQPVSVEYVNIAGVRSSKPWQGVNIVVTRYSDGTTTTAKVVK